MVRRIDRHKLDFDQWPSEIHLLRLCARTRTSCAAEQRICNILQSPDFDWTAFIQAAIAEQVVALIHQSFERVCADLVPNEILDAMAVFVAMQKKQNQVLMDELLAVLQAAEEQGIPTIPFKGPVLAQTVYGDLALRQFVDLDVVVVKEKIVAFGKLLVERGYSDITDPVIASTLGKDGLFINERNNIGLESHRAVGAKHLLFFRHYDGIRFEPHWAIASKEETDCIDHDGLWRRSSFAKIDEVKIRVFAPEDTLIILCVHGASHRWSPLKWICDIAELVAGDMPIAWDIALKRARAQGVERMVLLGVLLAKLLFEARLPPVVVSAIERDKCVSDLALDLIIYALNRARHPDNRLHDPDILWRVKYLLRLRERHRDKLTFLKIKLAAKLVAIQHLLLSLLYRCGGRYFGN